MKKINYAHRGASEYAAQNTFAAFYLGLACGADGIETDIRRTSDGRLVLFHDKLLEGTTDGVGTVSEHTWEELSRLTVRGKLADDKIVLLEDFLERFAWRGLELALELKQGGTAAEVAALVHKYGIEATTVITSFSFERLEEMKKASPELRLGWLVKDMEPETVKAAVDAVLYQICPPAALVTPEAVSELKAMGLSVRAWGVSDVSLMKSCADAGVDGMTVNFPDKLTEYLKSR